MLRFIVNLFSCSRNLKILSLKNSFQRCASYFSYLSSSVEWILHLILQLVTSQFHNVDQSRNNVMNMTIFKKLKRAEKYFWTSKKKITHLINNICFRLWSIKKKRKHGTHNVKINVGKYNEWYMKRIINELMAK